MKAAVIKNLGDTPKYENFPTPSVNAGEVAVKVKAVVLDYALKGITSGIHFASKQFYPKLPAVVGYTGIGELADGTLVNIRGIKPPFGSLAETVVIPQNFATPIPKGVSAEQAAAIPSAALSSLVPLQNAAKLQAGETVLINGATSVSGMLAVQIAKNLGAGRVVATGRNAASGEKLLTLGADAFINLDQPDENVVADLKNEAGDGYDVILDYLWGHPAELIVSTFTPAGMGVPSKRTRFVLIGGLAGKTAAITGQSLLTSGLEIYGMGAQATPEARIEGTKLIWGMLQQGKLSMEIETHALADIETAWNTEQHGKRIVIVP
ncbi:zinc-binding alcohol dehydrogenase family protein [Periweissella cryptocerci]|uniref:Zinc-binding alcohol dehydrogenase family protein n=1 Tax=Periweissella cryptocerci TaxID=2506420 RepID=A0A4P6YU39_9LACO|nr:zinc-binding alcohol dehydrogenase family protein [Periweissella cryptocerci]QBO36226.1 zinc-binding alcohol dehydrogenase family protein [Periweissella cryptocerci]